MWAKPKNTGFLGRRYQIGGGNLRKQTYEAGTYRSRPLEGSRAPEIHRPRTCRTVQRARCSPLVFPQSAHSRNYHYVLNVIHHKSLMPYITFFFPQKENESSSFWRCVTTIAWSHCSNKMKAPWMSTRVYLYFSWLIIQKCQHRYA